jgi:ADP-heptose:LPS heptosyltransferase
LRRLPGPPRRALFIRPGGIGDAVLLLPTLQEFKQAFPDCALDILAEQRNAGAFTLIPGLREIFTFDCPTGLAAVLKCRYDVVIDTEQWHRLSAVICRLIRSEMKIGFATMSGLACSPSVSYDLDRYEVKSFDRLPRWESA